MYKPTAILTRKMTSIKHCVDVACYLARVQATRELLAEEVCLWWLVALANIGDYDEAPASNTYARHGGRKSTADCRKAVEDDERERTRSGGFASGVS